MLGALLRAGDGLGLNSTEFNTRSTEFNTHDLAFVSSFLQLLFPGLQLVHCPVWCIIV